MARVKARVAIDVMLREGILDPQGQTVERNLPSLGFDGVSGVRIGKHIELEIEAPSRADAERQIKQMSEKLLSNPVIEDFTFRIEE
jgi:phosphoribosylformylglycinamidine synthase PurS subunit